MARSVYIATSEPNSGKTIVALGVMEAAMRRTGRVAFFRPVIRTRPENDASLCLMRHRYRLSLPPEAMFGVNRETVRKYLSADQTADLIKLILDKFKGLEEQVDFVVCEGTSFAGLAPAYEFELNAEIATNLGASVLQVVSARHKSETDLIDAIRISLDQLSDHRCDVLAAIANFVAPDQLNRVKTTLRNAIPQIPVYAIPLEPALDKPSVGEIATAIGAKPLTENQTALDGSVSDYVVAAMSLANFLDHLREGSLVITPGDRADILVGSLASVTAHTLPNIAGVVLTGGLIPPAQVMRLVSGLSSVPIVQVESDTFETALAVASVPSALLPSNEAKIASALGLFEANVDVDELEARFAAPRVTAVTPLMFEYELIRRAKASQRHIVLPEGAEPRILRAVDTLRRRDVVRLTLLGDEAEIHAKANSLGVALDDVEIINPMSSSSLERFISTYFELRRHKGMTEDVARDRMTDASYYGTMMVYLGMADGMVSGSVHTTAHTIRPAFEFIKTRPGVSVVSSVFFMCLADRVLVYGDCAVNPNPTAAQLAEIAASSADTAAAFGIEPRVAMLSYSTGASGEGADVDKVREATRLARRRRPELRIEGPIQYDAAVDTSVAQTKLPGSEVAGRATVFVFPDLNTGNNTYKAVQRSSGAVAIGPILQGLRKPVNDLSRGCTVPDIVNTVAITAIQAQLEDGEACGEPSR